MTIPTLVVAHEILQQNKAKGRTTTPLQLIKLAYLAHGWNLAFYSAPLFLEDIKAWRYGPVIPSLYNKVKHFRDRPIDTDLCADKAEVFKIPEDQQQVINEVMRVYGEFSGTQLSALTHQEGTPWTQTEHGQIISNTLIKNHFDGLNKAS